MMYHCRLLAHVHLLHPVRACELINQLAKNLVSSLNVSQTAFVMVRSEKMYVVHM